MIQTCTSFTIDEDLEILMGNSTKEADIYRGNLSKVTNKIIERVKSDISITEINDRRWTGIGHPSHYDVSGYTHNFNV